MPSIVCGSLMVCVSLKVCVSGLRPLPGARAGSATTRCEGICKGHCRNAASKTPRTQSGLNRDGPSNPGTQLHGLEAGHQRTEYPQAGQAFAGIPSTSASGERSPVISKMESSFVILRVSRT